MGKASRYCGALRAMLPALAALLLASCVTGTTAVSTDLNTVKHDTIQNRKEIDALRQEVAALRGQLQAMKGTLTSDEVVGAIRTSQTALYSQVTAMTGEVQAMAATVDDVRHETRKTIESMAAELDVIKSRVEGGAGTGLDDISARIAAIEGSLGILKAQVAALSGNAPADAPGGEQSPDALYKQAYNLFEKRKYKESREQMQDFLKKHPSSNLAGNALFWIGESYYNQKQYDSAILSYQDVIEKHPGNRKVPAAMLKQAYAFIELGDNVAARGILKTLLSQHPDSDMAGHAKARLEEIK